MILFTFEDTVRHGFPSPRHFPPEGLSLQFGQPQKSAVVRRISGRGVDLAGPGMPEILSLGRFLPEGVDLGDLYQSPQPPTHIGDKESACLKKLPCQPEGFVAENLVRRACRDMVPR